MAIYSVAALKSELQNDPNSIGFAALITSGSPQAACNLINVIGVGSAYVVTLSGIMRQALIFGAVLQIQTEINTGLGADGVNQLTATVKQVWSAITQAIYSSDPGVFIPFSVFGTRNPIGDNVLTAAQVLAITQRQGSRAEVLWGPGTVVPLSDVGATGLFH